MTPDRARRVQAGLIVGLAVAVWIDTLGYPTPVVRGAPGPAFLPRILAIVLALCGGVLAVRRPDRGADGPAVGEGPAGSEPGAPVKGAGVVLAIVAIGAFNILAPVTSTVAMLPVPVAALMLLLGERRWTRLVSVPLLFAAFVTLVFVRGFGVALPGAW